MCTLLNRYKTDDQKQMYTIFDITANKNRARICTIVSNYLNTMRKSCALHFFPNWKSMRISPNSNRLTVSWQTSKQIYFFSKKHIASSCNENYWWWWWLVACLGYHLLLLTYWQPLHFLFFAKFDEELSIFKFKHFPFRDKGDSMSGFFWGGFPWYLKSQAVE